MKITLNPGPFAAALAVASTAVKRSSVLPILNHVLLEAEGERLTISGTDLESRAWHAIACTVEEPGAVALPPKALADFLDAVIPTEPVTLAVDEKHKAELVSGRTRIRVAGIDAEQFPICPSFDDPAFDYTMGAADLAALIRSTAFAAAKDDSRPVLAGVLFQAGDGMLRLVAADGHRLATREAHLDDIPALEEIVHGRMLGKLVGHLDKATSARLLVDAGRSSLLVDTEQGCWTIRIVEGQFPDWRRIAPVATASVVNADLIDLKRAITLSQGVEQTSIGYRVYLDVQQDETRVWAGTDTGDRSASSIIATEMERGSPISISFNAAYLKDAIDSIEGTRVALDMNRFDTPALVRAAGPRNGHLNVLMPIIAARPS